MADLRCEIKSLKDTVKTLQNELDFVLSFLGITSSNRQVTNAEQPGQQSSHVVATSSQTDGAVSTEMMSLSSVATSKLSNCPDVSVNNDRSQMIHSYANVVNKPAALSVPFRNAVVSAVYADFEEKDRRAKTVVISGLSLSSLSDKAIVEKLCSTEFRFVPHINRCRRLGQPRSGRIQPVLVVLESATNAEFLDKNAKMLRHSADPIVRNSVFINADLTKAEALTAYQRRCRRRELATARRSADNDSVSQSITVLNTRVTSADGSSTQSVSTGAVTVLQSSVDDHPAVSNDRITADNIVTVSDNTISNDA